MQSSAEPLISAPEASASSYRLQFGQQLFVLIALLSVEWIAFTSRFFSAWPRLPQAGAAFLCVFAACVYARQSLRLAGVAHPIATSPRLLPSLIHIAAVLACVAAFRLPAIAGNGRGGVILVAAAVAGVSAVSAFFPGDVLFRSAGRAPSAWIFGLLAAIVTGNLDGIVDGLWNETSWNPLTSLTFGAVKWTLGLFVPRVETELARLKIGTPLFRVRIEPACSGIEGLALILVFTAAWLWFFRRENRFPQALLLIPASLLVMFSSNIVRITALILIGNAGFRNVAAIGFHSHAGWIAFIGVSFAFLAAVQQLPWIAAGQDVTRRESTTPAIGPRNPTAVYLIPFIAITLAGLVSKAASDGGIEWFYGLRLLGAAAVLWHYRAEYRSFNWRIGWLSPCIGTAVFALWILFDMGSGGNSGVDNAVAVRLTSLALPVRWIWLSCRAAAAILTVPIAEELAFRGYAARRLMAEDFERIDARSLALLPILLSSLLFGAMHGSRWMEGTLAGLAYAGAYRWKGRIGDAVAAHGITNALLAAWVFFLGSWHLW